MNQNECTDRTYVKSFINMYMKLRGVFEFELFIDMFTLGYIYKGCSKYIALFYLETTIFKLAQKWKFHAIKLLQPIHCIHFLKASQYAHLGTVIRY